MKKINYDEHVEKIKEKSTRLHAPSKSRLGMPLRSNKMRDPQEEIALFLKDLLEAIKLNKNKNIWRRLKTSRI